MLIFNTNTKRNTIILIKEIPSYIKIQSNSPGLAHFNDSCEHSIGCIGCPNPRCIHFSPREIECDFVEGFSCDKSTNVCPVDAIYSDPYGMPVIDNQKCISCGICVSRCPIGALYFLSDGTLMLDSGTFSMKYRYTMPYSQKALQEVQLQIDELIKVKKTGVFLNACDRVMERIYRRIKQLESKYHNYIARNLLIALGCKCSIRRIGDVYTRMDAIYSSPKGSFGSIEVEFGRDTLEASRAILDDVAVLYTRYGINKRNNLPVVVCLQLPNARQGYWQVVKDVNTVEKIKIETVTIGSLLILLWNRCVFEPENERYYIDYDNMNLREVISNQIGCSEIDLSGKELGILEPIK